MKKQTSYSVKSTLIQVTILIFVSIILAACAAGAPAPQVDESQPAAAEPGQPTVPPRTLVEEEPSPGLAEAVEAMTARKAAEVDPGTVQGAGSDPAIVTEPASQVEESSLGSQPVQPVDSQAKRPPSAPEVGATAPGFSLKSLDGQEIRLENFQGRPILINYWVTWCVPCMEELPALDQLSREYPDLVILTVNGTDQDDLATIQQKISEIKLALPVLLDSDKSFWHTYQMLFLPTSFFIDRSLVIRHIQLGSLSEAELRKKINDLVNGNL